MITLPGRAWDAYFYWQNNDKKVRDRINALIKECERMPFNDTGKLELLKLSKQGYWSRRVNEKDRLIYKILDKRLYIASCKDHYEDE